MGKHAKTLKLLEIAVEVLTAHHPMTVRQVYYQLVSRQVIENNRGQYQAVSNALVKARQEGLIPWDWIEDRLRRPRGVPMWDDLGGFAYEAVSLYRRDVWATQSLYLFKLRIAGSVFWAIESTRALDASAFGRSTGCGARFA
jgi:hypothetical protein